MSVVSLKKKVVFIPAALAKNHKGRKIPLSKELVALFERLPRPSKSGRVFLWKSTPKCFKMAIDSANLKGVDLYTMKHTAASRMIRAGVDLITVTELIGHPDPKTTMIYCHSSSETKNEAVAKLSQVYFPSSRPSAASMPDVQATTIPSVPKLNN